ncbi:hypothetical protein, variant [Exophiala mesophila]|uniref:Uncharacterized protein n=1 Tax=Exophiala mesophila TaxID=212818 RepID=A0A0D1ZUK4_EXOME|nr:uncharacterized protein PV10_01887 [Exophiala mesophila]XP_016229787.1 hypothetical protein, variant [Exophiala mesophila]KIV98212.1 hypothetical protein PV10_01887 [Exophiala mesophila]KIV98213.1 hypothetical protein, variant [Exophiala mesophila]
MPSIFSKLKGSRTQKAPTQPVRKPYDDERSHSIHTDDSEPSNDTDRSNKVLEVLRTFNIKHVKTIADLALVGANGEPIDDKTYLMERIIQLAADLPVDSRTSATLTNSFLHQLWTDLQHPPKSYLGEQYAYRKADGSNNNILWPHLGAAGQPYARTVRPRLIQPVARPDPGVIFDSLLARKKFSPHPNKISSVLFYVASIIIHDIFHTSHVDYSISETSSYLDLAPLYGNSVSDQREVRTLENGRLKPDCFFDKRILGFPPGVGALLIFFNRFHNHVAENLARIDEGGRFFRILHPAGRPRPADADELYDEALFQTARLVTTGLYINIILKDYVRTILNLNRVDSNWNLDPRAAEGQAFFGKDIAEATGNSVSAEFNLVYRWHSCVSERDEQWTKDVYTQLLGGSGPLTLSEFLYKLNDWARKLDPDVLKRDFAGLKRLPDGRYSDQDLASIWTASVEDVAGSFGALHVPEILRNVEILGIIQARSWNLATLNEFREYFKLQPHKTFESINPDPIVSEQLRRLYGHPDHVEIYPGVVVESTKVPKLPGSGLCTNFTTSRAILSDAVALVRGDRFYTVDYTPANLTNWGYNEADYNTSINYGCVIYKLVLNALPHSYAPNSIYAHFPLVIPSENKAILTRLKKADFYDFEKPTGVPVPVVVSSFEAIQTVTSQPKTFAPWWNPLHFCPTLGVPKSEHTFPLLAQGLAEIKGLGTATAAFYKDAIATLLKSESYQLGSAGLRQVDAVRDVFNIAHARFVASLFLIPLQSDQHGSANHWHQELNIISSLSSVYSSVADSSPARRFVVTRRKQKQVQQLAEQIQEEVDRVVKASFGLHAHSTAPLRTFAVQAVQSASKSKLSTSDMVWHQILPLAARVFVSQSVGFAEALDYLFGTGAQRPPQFSELVADPTWDKIYPSVSEISRLRPGVPLHKQATSAVSIKDGEEQLQVSAGQKVLCNLGAASRDATVFPQPDEFQLGRDGSLVDRSTLGPEVLLEKRLLDHGFSATFEKLAKLNKIGRAAGATGRLRRIEVDNMIKYLNLEESKTVSYPVAFKIDWQG